MTWQVIFEKDFDSEFRALPRDVQSGIVAGARLLRGSGPKAGRPNVDTLKGSAFPNMKELRFRAANGAWRVAFAFDPARRAVLLVAADKAGVPERRFYRELLATADRRFSRYLERLAGSGEKRRR